MEKLLLATATKTETKAVLSVFEKATKSKKEPQRIEDKTYYRLGILGDIEISLVQSEVGTATPDGSLITLYQAFKTIDPSAVIMIGIAFGMIPEEQRIGDVLVSQFIQAYEPARIGKSPRPRGVLVNASSSLLDVARTIEIDWSDPQVHIGLVVSGEKLVDDIKFRSTLKKKAPDAIGGEMEGNGLYVSANKAKIDWILVKGISDWADGNKSKEYQPLAARNAAKFALAMIRMLTSSHSSEQVTSALAQSPKTEKHAISSGSVTQVKNIVLKLAETFSSEDRLYPDQCDDALLRINEIKAHLNYHWITTPSEYATLANLDYINAQIDLAQAILRSLREQHSSGQSKQHQDIQNILRDILENLPTSLK